MKNKIIIAGLSILIMVLAGSTFYFAKEAHLIVDPTEKLEEEIENVEITGEQLDDLTIPIEKLTEAEENTKIMEEINDLEPEEIDKSVPPKRPPVKVSSKIPVENGLTIQETPSILKTFKTRLGLNVLTMKKIGKYYI